MEPVIDILRRTTEFLGRRGVPSPKLEAELLLSHALGLRSRLDLYLQHDRPLVEAEVARLRELVRRRGAREPWQHLVGEVVFHGVKLKVDRRALIPRHETEELVELLAERLKERPPARVLDLGTGSGALALALAAAFPAAEVLGVDRSVDALALAVENRALNPGVASRVKFQRSDWLRSVKGTFDLVVANPPYLTEEEWAEAEPEVREHDPREALVAAEDGLADLLAILAAVPAHLAPGGLLACETGTGHPPRLAALATTAAGWAAAECLHDLSGRPRFFLATRAGAGA